MKATKSNDMSDPKAFGKAGEELAASHLKRLGYKILERNYTTPTGEIDIIAMDGATLVFVEVKSRKGDGYGAPELAVNFHKRRQLARAALAYIGSKKKGDMPCRFDVVGISPGPGDGLSVTVIKDAFELAGGY